MTTCVEMKKAGRDYVTGFQVVKALREVDLVIAAGEFTSIAGPSGSGKTTLLNLVGCLDAPTTGQVLPAMGYGRKQMEELSETIAKTPCDLVIVATPIDLRRVVEITKPNQRVLYELQEIGKPNLPDILSQKFS